MTVSPILRILLFTLLLGLALFQLRLAVIAQSSFSGLTPNKGVRKYQNQPHLLVAYGKQSLFEQGNLKVVEQWYRKALQSNPFYIPAWLALAELRNDEGNTTNALAILKYVDTLTQDVGRWRWGKTMLAYQLDQTKIVKNDLAWLIQQEKITGRTRKKAIKLAFSLWPEPDNLLHNMGEKNVFSLFKHAVRTNNLTVAKAFWPLVDQSAPSTEQVLPFINRLINDNDIPLAARIWKKYYPSDQLLYNGDFANPPVKGGFGWRLGKNRDVVIATDPNSGLHLQFTGTDNINFFHVSQYIAVSPQQNYRLSGKIKSNDLTTDQRPFIEVVGLHCSMRPQQSKMAETRQDWSSFQLNFTVPEGCRAVLVRIRRKPSNQIDNLIQGELWVNNLVFEEIEGLSEKIRVSPLTIAPSLPISPSGTHN